MPPASPYRKPLSPTSSLLLKHLLHSKEETPRHQPHLPPASVVNQSRRRPRHTHSSETRHAQQCHLHEKQIILLRKLVCITRPTNPPLLSFFHHAHNLSPTTHCRFLTDFPASVPVGNKIDSSTKDQPQHEFGNTPTSQKRHSCQLPPTLEFGNPDGLRFVLTIIGKAGKTSSRYGRGKHTQNKNTTKNVVPHGGGA